MVGRGTPEPKRSGTSHKTSNGNGGRTENPPALAVGSANRDRNIEYKEYVYDAHIKALSNRIIKDSWKNSSHCTIIRLA